VTAILKHRYHHNGLINFDEIWHVDNFWYPGFGQTIISFIVFIIQDGGTAAILESETHCNISKAFGPTLMKFVMLIHIGLPGTTGQK